jgi:glycosyltransferase involved in cell wall biosynthesis
MALTVLIAHPGAELYGADRVMLESVDAFVERGWRVAVALPTDGPLVAEVERRGGVIHRCPTPVLRKSYLRGLGPLRLALLTLGSVRPGLRTLGAVRPDVVYVSTITAPLWLALARARRVPTICHVHEAEASVPRLVRVAMACPLLLAHRLIVASRFSVSVLAGAIPRLARRCAVIHNGVPGPSELVPPRHVVDGEVRLLYVGRLSERKGLTDAVDAVDLLIRRGVPAVLNVVGAVFPGYEWFEDQLRRHVDELGLGDRVTFRGFDPDIWAHLARSDLLLVPSRTDEPFGNTAVEGALAGRPVVASTSGGLVEAIQDLRASRGVPPGAPAAIADAVEQVVADWVRIRVLALDDAARAAARHSPATYRTKVADEVAALLRAVGQRSTRRRVG